MYDVATLTQLGGNTTLKQICENFKKLIFEDTHSQNLHHPKRWWSNSDHIAKVDSDRWK